ncbi:MAG: ABC transporter permease subunit, partial [Myxococcales bacterium]|nr:ABC transporter permease subunit [Myxococcales bacterium]
KTQSLGIELHISGPRASLGRMSAVMGNTLREAGRTRIFYGLLAVAVLLLLSSVVLSDLALVDQQARLVQDFGLFTIPLVTVLTAIILGVTLLQKEIEKKTLYAILPKPIRRGEFLLGKYFGLCTLLAIEMTLLSLCWFAVLSLRGGEIGLPIISALFLSYIEVLLVTAVATFFSALSTPLLSGVFTLGLFAIGRASYVVVDLMSAKKGVFVEVPAMRSAGRAIVAIVPDLSTFNIADELLLGWEVPTEYLLQATGYGLSYAAIFLVLGLFVFERRDLT